MDTNLLVIWTISILILIAIGLRVWKSVQTRRLQRTLKGGVFIANRQVVAAIGLMNSTILPENLKIRRDERDRLGSSWFLVQTDYPVLWGYAEWDKKVAILRVVRNRIIFHFINDEVARKFGRYEEDLNFFLHPL